jgi:hypothetical protein
MVSFMLVLALIFVSGNVFAQATARDEEIAALKLQVQQLLKRIEALEQNPLQAKEEAPKQKQGGAPKDSPAVTMASLASKLKIKGRWAAGYLDSGKDFSFRSGSFELPDAKVTLAFEPDEINKITMRLNLNNASFNSVDYSYLETDLAKLLNLPVPLNSRLGRLRLEFGEEILSNNPVESALPSNSAFNTDAKDEGVQLYGKLFNGAPLNYIFSVSNGNSGTGTDNSSAKAFTGKVFYRVIPPLYVSASYFDSGSMKASNSEMSIAGVTSKPDGAFGWSRRIWEADVRYDLKKGKVFEPIAYSDSKAIIRGAYGEFSDDILSGTAGSPDRSGKFAFAETVYNLNRKFYLAGRVSFISLDDDVTASLNGITSNSFERYSLGLGYRLTRNTLLKLSYDWNKESGPNVEDADNNLLSALVVSQF